jgi:Holliday junction resolvasome RuvABC DNA-binding subunit
VITLNRVHPSGTLEVRAMVLETTTRQVWQERQTYYGYNNNEARKLFRQHLVENGFVLVND